MSITLSHLLNAAAAPEGSTPYVSRIYDNLVLLLHQRGEVDDFFLMHPASLSDDPELMHRVAQERQEFMDAIEHVFGRGSEYEEAAMRAFEYACPSSIIECLHALADHVVPSFKIEEHKIRHENMYRFLAEHRVPPLSRMGRI